MLDVLRKDVFQKLERVGAAASRIRRARIVDPDVNSLHVGIGVQHRQQQKDSPFDMRDLVLQSGGKQRLGGSRSIVGSAGIGTRTELKSLGFGKDFVDPLYLPFQCGGG